jgi:pSer/pThr/pTyr-binding forkhead associated (FHA) protein
VATQQKLDPAQAGSARPLEAYIDDAHKLPPDEFQARYGEGFLLLTAAGLTVPSGPCSTDVKLFDEDGSAHTANVSTLVYPVRRTERSVVHLLTLGRATNNDVVVRDVSISRFHAFVKRGDDEEFLLQDAGSTNGTAVNGAAVSARGNGPPTALKAGDTVRLGQVEFTFVDTAALRQFVLKALG